MQKQGILHQKALFNFVTKTNGQIDFEHTMGFGNLFLDTSITKSCQLKARIQCLTGSAIPMMKVTSALKLSKIKSTLDENVEELSDDDDELCPVDCVREFNTDEEFSRILEKAKESNALVVVDFYRTSCGSCKYIEQGFMKLCKGSGDQEAPVVFLKHNVLDEYDEQSEVAERLRIRTVPLFHFYKNGVLLEAFPTRDKERILEAILKYTASAPQEVESTS
ncbi:thioredoxin-like 4, chloroplastic [Sesamum indicum]|uniref:Thioredoxin-like 4, chloroplastic n=1 Tax=Sesamum indicum TaxID=4182 RepID=A0A6I9TIB1_SESIN|nr:thioredoxin-like 4, chloroplastic [Sesamum indicum]